MCWGIHLSNITTIPPAVFSLSGILLAWSLFRFQFLDLVPLAHDTVINNLNDGLIVLDHNNRIIDINPAVKKNIEYL